MQSGNKTEDNIDEDHVVKKIPVYLSNGLNGKLHMLEFQREAKELRDLYLKQKVVTTLVKPIQQKIEMSVELSKDSQNFNPVSAKQLASKLPKPADNSQPQVIENTILASSTGMKDCEEKYAIGFVHENSPGQLEIHINSIKAMQHLKPSYKYLDGGEKNKQNEIKTDLSNDSSGTMKAIKSINVRFARQDPKRIKLAQSKSLSAQQRLKDEEPWCNVEHFSPNSTESKLDREKLLSSQHESNTSLILVDKPKSFIPIVCGKKEKSTNDNIDNNDAPKSAEYINKLQFNEQVIERMKQAKVITFSKLKQYLDCHKSDSEILSSLQRIAIPIQGNWVVNSELLYSDNYISRSGVKAESLRKARNHILLLFTKQEIVKQKEISEETGLPPNDILDILSGLAIQQKRTRNDSNTGGWRFKLPIDEYFLQRFPDEVTRLSTRFELKVINAARRNTEEEEPKPPHHSPSKKNKCNPPRQRKNSTKSRKDSYSSDH